MIKLQNRKEITFSRKIIQSELAKFQSAFFDEEILQFYKEDKEEYLYLDRFDFIDNEVLKYESHHKVIGIKHADINTYPAILAQKLTELFKLIEVHEIGMISHLKCDLLSNAKNGYKPLAQSYKKLKSIIGQTVYEEALLFNLDGLSEIVPILFWITRCDMTMPEYIFLFDMNERLSINFCQYGNVHLTEFGSEVLTKKVLENMGWEILEGNETDRFENNNQITGRRLKI